MNKSEHTTRRSFLAGLGGALAAASMRGFTPASAAEPADQSLRTDRLGDIDRDTTFDVCIIGSGFAGAILGDSLARRGIKTVILESGPDPRSPSIDPRYQQLDAYRSIGPIQYPMQSTRFRGVGGTSWLWGGMCPRLHPLDLEPNSFTPEGAAWPITYSELKPFYVRAETALGVRGGDRSVHHPPRAADFPVEPDRDHSPLQAMLEKVGIVIADIPHSTPTDRDLAVLSDRFGPFVKMTDSYLPAFQASPSGSLVSGATVTKLNVDESGRITGAEVKDLDRQRKLVRARVFVVACGGLETPRLLLLSRSAKFPRGLGNNQDLVGRFFMEHRPTMFQGQMNVGWDSFSFYQLKGKTYQYYEQFKKAGLGGMVLGFDMEGAIDGRLLRAGAIGKSLARLRSRILEISIGSEMKPIPENRVALDPKIKDYFGNPGANLYLTESAEDGKTIDRGREIVKKLYASLGIEKFKEMPREFWAHHHMGTCRMGNDPRTSVVDRNLRVHGTKNLFLAGSSVFVTCGVSNPTLTLTALALRLGEYLPAELKNGVFPLTGRNSKT